MNSRAVTSLFITLIVLSLILCPSYDAPARINDTDSHKDFALSADGAESDESITSFAETLPDDDVLFYPDRIDTGVRTADNGICTAGTETNSWTDTQAVGGLVWTGTHSSVELELQWAGATDIDGFDYALYLSDDDDGFAPTMEFYNTSSTAWETWFFINNDLTWHNGSIHSSNYWNSTGGITIRGLGTGSVSPEIDYAELVIYRMTLSDSDHYAESFADVSDWDSTLGEEDTDGDIGWYDILGDYAYDHFWTNDIALPVGTWYLEFRAKANITATTGYLNSFAEDDYSGASKLFTGYVYLTTDFISYKYTFTTTVISESILWDSKHATLDHRISFDYLRIGPADEMGWQHDGSTTTGVIDDSNAGYDYTYTSDGDILSVKIKSVSGGSDIGNVTILYDTTDTSIDIDRDYYQFLEVRYRVVAYSGAFYVGGIPNLDGYKSILGTDGIYCLGLVDWQILRMNLLAMSTVSTDKGFKIVVGTFQSGQYVTIEIDYIKYYSIANFTLSQSAVTTNDVLYVDSSILYSTIDDGYIEANHDPALSVASASYAVYNLTTSNSAPEFSQYVSEWSTYSAETRGATTSGTVTDIKLRFDASEILSAITFIEDGTNPTVIRSNVNPPEPDDDETVTLSSVITDGVEVYSVKYNALVYPAGFSDVDYSATETATNFWTYSFSSGVLPTGYYSFSVIANDGANENGLLTEPEYIDFTVRASEIIISPITFFGVGSDFSQMQLSFEINKDCTFTIYEASASYSLTATHTGSVTKGWSNIAWDKISVTDTAANFSISFVSGSLSTWINGTYAVAQTTFYVERYEHNGPDAAVNVTVNGRITKLASYTIYIDNAASIDEILAGSGTVTSLDFEIEFPKLGAEQAWHNFAIEFTNGSQTCWANGTFYRWKYIPDKPELGGAPDPNSAPTYTVTVLTLLAVVGIGVYVATQGSKEGNL